MEQYTILAEVPFLPLDPSGLWNIPTTPYLHIKKKYLSFIPSGTLFPMLYHWCTGHPGRTPAQLWQSMSYLLSYLSPGSIDTIFSWQLTLGYDKSTFTTHFFKAPGIPKISFQNGNVQLILASFTGSHTCKTISVGYGEERDFHWTFLKDLKK